jgi:Xaa-Pro aminopeptidase
MRSAGATATQAAIAEHLARRREAVAERWNLSRELVLVGAGAKVPVPGRGDRTYPFRSHSEYLYLTDRERPGGVLAFDPQEGWIDFVVPVTREERLWEGGAPSDEGVPVSELAGWLEERKDRRVGALGSPIEGVSSAPELESQLRAELNAVRRQKDEVELSRMRQAERATAAGFAAVVPLLEPGRTERQVQIELEAEFFRNGADSLAFDTIVGGGPNSAVLHFPPTDRPFADGDLVLIDAGAEFRGYASDITRTYPVSGRFTPEQKALYVLVRAAALAARGRCIAGSEWRDVHRTATLVIAEGLVDFGLLRGDPETLVERGSVSVFFPHGVGHMVGLGVRDAGEVLPGREVDENAFPRLRVDLPLLPGYVVTVEPGVYLPGWGGVRIEDMGVLTPAGFEVMTAAPKPLRV